MKYWLTIKVSYDEIKLILKKNKKGYGQTVASTRESIGERHGKGT